MKEFRLTLCFATLFTTLFPSFAQAQSPTEKTVEEKISVYQKAIESLQAQIDTLRKEMETLKKATPKPASTGASPIAFLQAQYDSNQANSDSKIGLRRARFGFAGSLANNFRYEVLGDFAFNTAPLRNASIDYVGTKGALKGYNVRFGQFKLPFTREQYLTPVQSTIFIERGIAIDQLATSHERDGGVMLYSDREADRPIGFALGIFNGAGRNQLVATPSKIFSARVQYSTPQKHPIGNGSLKLGFSTRQGSNLNLNLPAATQHENERYGFDIQFISPKWLVQGEYLWGRNASLNPSGFYAFTGYNLNSRWQFLVRYEGFSFDKAEPFTHRTTIGATFKHSKDVQSMLNYEFAGQNVNGIGGSGLRFRLQTLLH